ncbi:hypothetical protein [Arcanobacterium phocae]|uniref:hypothetical protein n=1 Tax=Arcanobacterium phocae TaxID=131112 RepID=UPI001C0EE9C8|nr:hypothetical protein [Arcanobacterium phocae]
MFKQRNFASLAVLTIAFLGIQIPAHAVGESVYTNGDLKAVTEFWTDNGVSADVQDSLIEKIRSGKLTDADAGTVEAIRSETIYRHGNQETILTYPDGSITVTAMQVAPGQFDASSFGDEATNAIMPQSAGLYGCRIWSGSGYAIYSGCTVFGSTGTVQAGFAADYQLVNGAYDKIIRHYAPFQQCAGVICDTPYLAFSNLYETSSSPTEVTYFFRWSGIGAFSSTGRVGIVVGNDHGYVEFKAKV